MPKNKLIYYGILLVAAAALLYLGYYVFSKAMAVVIAVAAIGIIMIIVGMAMESQKRKEAQENKPESPNV